MVDRLQRYRRRPLQLADVPSVDFVSAGRAQMQAARGISGALNQMAEFAFEAEKKEAVQYGVENAPTAEQAMQARASGTDLGLPEGDIARASALAVLNSRLEIAAQDQVRSLDANPKTASLTPAEYATELNSIIDGMGSVLDEYGTKAAGAKFRAKMSTVYNNKLNAFNKRIVDQQIEDNRATEFAGARNTMDTFSTIIEGGAVVGADGNVTSPVEIIENEIKEIYGRPHLSATEKKGLVAEAELRKKLVIEQRVGEWILDKPTEHVTQILTGEVDDPNVAILLNSLPPEDRREVVLAASKQIEENEVIQKNLYDSIERKNKIVADKHSSLATQAALANDPEERDAQLAALRDIDPDEANKLETGFRKEGGIDNPDVIDALRVKSAQGTITLSDVVGARGDMSASTFKDLLGAVDARRNDDHNVALDLARATLGIPKNALTVDKEKGARLAKFENELNLAAKADPTINRIAWARDYVDSKMEEEVEQAKAAARVSLDAAKEVQGIETDDEFIAYVQTQINNKAYYRRQMRYLRTLGLVAE